MKKPKRYPMLDDDNNSDAAVIMAMPDTPLPEDDDTVPFLIKGDEPTEEVKPQITMDVLPPEVQAFIKEQIIAAVAQSTAAMLSAQPILSDIKDQLDHINEASKVVIESNKVEEITTKEEDPYAELCSLDRFIMESTEHIRLEQRNHW